MTGQTVDTGRRWVELMDIDQLPGAARNPKKHNIPELRAAVGRFGFVDPMTLDERTGRLVAGHGRRDTLRGLRDTGEPPPKGVQVGEHGEWLAPVLRGWASDTDVEAGGYLASNNRQAELGGWDNDGLVELLGEQDDFTGLGWAQEEIDRLLDPPLPGDGDAADDGKADDEDDAEDPQPEPPAAAGFADYGVLIVCADAVEQADVYAQLQAEGFDCRPLKT